MTRIAGVIATLVLGGCYAEVGGSLYPVVHQTWTPAHQPAMSTDTHAWGLLFKLGLYLDIPIRRLRSAVGIGFAPSGLGGEAIAPAEGPDRFGVTGSDVRLDVAAPVFLLRGHVQPRLSLVVGGVTDLTVDVPDHHLDVTAAGSSWFLGASLGTHTRGSTVLLGAGLQRLWAETRYESVDVGDQLEVSAWGAGARLLITWTPSGKLMQYYTPTPIEPQQRGSAGCYYADHCDVDGHCTTTWTCP